MLPTLFVIFETRKTKNLWDSYTHTWGERLMGAIHVPLVYIMFNLNNPFSEFTKKSVFNEFSTTLLQCCRIINPGFEGKHYLPFDKVLSPDSDHLLSFSVDCHQGRSFAEDSGHEVDHALGRISGTVLLVAAGTLWQRLIWGSIENLWFILVFK